MPSYRHQRTLVVVGDPSCGKTSLIFVLCRRPFPVERIFGAYENNFVSTIVGGEYLDIALTDTVATEMYDRLRTLCYPNTALALICFSIGAPQSLTNCQEKWVTEVKTNRPNIPYILVGCKGDIRDEDQTKNCVTREEALAVAQKIGAQGYFECSAKRSEGTWEVMQAVVNAMLPPEKRTKTGCVVV